MILNLSTYTSLLLLYLLSYIYSLLSISISVLRSLFTSFFTSMSPLSLYIYALFSHINGVIILTLFSYLSCVKSLFFSSFCYFFNSFPSLSSLLCTFFLFNIGFILSINACSIAT